MCLDPPELCQGTSKLAQIDATLDVIALLTVIQQCMMHGQMLKYDMYTTHDAEHQYYSLYQGAGMTDHDYYK